MRNLVDSGSQICEALSRGDSVGSLSGMNATFRLGLAGGRRVAVAGIAGEEKRVCRGGLKVRGYFKAAVELALFFSPGREQCTWSRCGSKSVHGCEGDTATMERDCHLAGAKVQAGQARRKAEAWRQHVAQAWRVRLPPAVEPPASTHSWLSRPPHPDSPTISSSPAERQVPIPP